MANLENKENSEDRIILKVNKSHDKIIGSGSKSYYASLILISILSLVITYVYMQNKHNVVKVSTILEGINWYNLLLLLLLFVLIMLISSLITFFKFHAKTKRKNFGLIYKTASIGCFYEFVTFGSFGKNVMQIKYLNEKNVSIDNSIDVIYDKSIFNRISWTIYSLAMIILGGIFWINTTNLWLYTLAIIFLIYNIGFIVLVLLFYKKKKSTIVFISKVIKLLYNIGIVKDYERAYTSVIDKLIVYSKSFKQNWILQFVDIIAGLLVNLLKGAILYYAIVSLNFGNLALIGEILFKCVVLESIIYIWPIQHGILVYEILFLSLFSNVFFEGYVFWGMLVYRFFTYYIYIINYLIILLFDLIAKKKKC